MTYREETVRAYFDELAEGEWDRLDDTIRGRTSAAMHRRLLADAIQPGMRILDVGCGPGRFAIDAIEAGATVTLADLSPTQLELALQNIEERGLGSSVAGAHEVSVLDLSVFAEHSFDAVVCFGGVLSYVRDEHPRALRELSRVLKPGGALLVGVMSLYGTMRLLGPLDQPHFVVDADVHLPWDQALAPGRFVLTNPDSPEFHQPIALFTAAGLRATLADVGFALERMATSNPLIPAFMRLPRFAGSPAGEDRLRELEVAISERPELLDAGEHLIALARKP